MENILINLTSDASGLQPGIDGLVQMNVVDKELADQVKKTNEEFVKGSKVTADSLKSSGAQLDKLSANFKNLDKSIVGGAYNKSLKDLQKQLQGTSDEFKQLALTVDFAKKKQEQFKPNSPEWKELQTQIEQAQMLLKAFGQEEEQTAPKTTSLRTQLRTLKDELSRLEEQGQENTARFEQLAIEAAQLEDQIGDTSARIRAMASDTANIDAVLEGVQLLSSGFQFAAGAEALFGAESEDMAKALVKLNAVMAITSSIQQVTNSLQNQSVVVIKAQAFGNAVLGASNKATAATFAALGVSVEATSFAFKALRAAIITTGIGALVVGVGFLIEKISTWTSSSDKATEAQKNLADAIRGVNEAILEQNSLYVAAISVDKAALEKQLALVQANGGSQLEQLKLRQQIADEDKKIGEQALENLGLTRTKLDIMTVEYNQGLTSIERLNKLLTQAKTDGKRKIIQDKLAAVKADIDSKKVLLDAGNQFLAQINSAETNSAAVAAETSKLISEKALKSATAFAEAKVLISKAGSRKELNAQIEAIRAAQREQLSNVELTAGERVKINTQADKQIADLQFEFEKKSLENAKKGVDAHVLKAKEGSKEELDFKLQSLQLGQEIELKDKELTDNKKLEIEARYQKEREDLIRAFNRKVAEDAINSRISELQAQNASLAISLDASTNAQLLQNKKQLVDEEAALEVISITESEKNEELRRLKIKAVYAQALADKQQLERDKNKADIDTGLANAENFYDRQIAKQNLVLQNEKSTAKQRRDALDETFRYQVAKIDAESLANQQAYDAGLIDFEAYMRRKNDLATQYDQVDLQREQAHQAELLQARELAQQTTLNLVNFVLSASKKGYDAEEERVKELYDQKRITEQEYNNRLKQIRHKQDQDAKAQALFTMLINQGPAVLQGFKDGGIAGAAAAFTLFFALLGTLQGTELPAYKDGEIRVQGPGTDTSDSITARISKNESIIKASQSKKHEGVLRAINEDRYVPYLMQYELPKLYQNMSMPELSEYVTHVTNQSHFELDYDKLGDVIAQKLAENPQSHLSIDEEGFQLSVRKGLDVINYVNKKLSI